MRMQPNYSMSFFTFAFNGWVFVYCRTETNLWVNLWCISLQTRQGRVDVTELISLDKGVPKVPLLLEHWKQPSVVLTNHTINVFVPFPWRCYVDSSKTHSWVQYPDKGVSGIVLPERPGMDFFYLFDLTNIWCFHPPWSWRKGASHHLWLISLPFLLPSDVSPLLFYCYLWGCK